MAVGKLFVSIAIVLLAEGSLVAAMDPAAEILVKHTQDLIKNGIECRNSVGATDEDVAIFLSKKLPDSKTGDCMIACMMEKMGTMVDGKFAQDVPKQIAHSILGEGEDLIADLVSDVSKACAKLLSPTDDKCTVGKKVAVCGMDHVKKFRDVTNNP